MLYLQSTSTVIPGRNRDKQKLREEQRKRTDRYFTASAYGCGCPDFSVVRCCEMGNSHEPVFVKLKHQGAGEVG